MITPQQLTELVTYLTRLDARILALELTGKSLVRLQDDPKTPHEIFKDLIYYVKGNEECLNL